MWMCFGSQLTTEKPEKKETKGQNENEGNEEILRYWNKETTLFT